MKLYLLGEAIVDEQLRTVRIGDNVQILTDLTWRFLMALIGAAPNAISQSDLAKQVWNAAHVSDETIAQRVRQLRQIFKDNPKAPTYIRTIRGGGYQLIPAIQQLSEQQDSKQSTRMPRKRFLIGAGLLLMALISALFVILPRSAVVEPHLLPGATPNIVELVERAHEYRRRGQYASNEHAIGLYEQVLNNNPKNVGALIGLSYAFSHKPSRYEESSQWAEKAADLAERALLIDSDNADAWAARGLADDARGRVNSAIAYYKKALGLDPDNADLRASIAYLLQVQGKLHEALTLDAEALRKASPTYFADYQIAITLEKSGLKNAANKWLQRAEQLRPDNVYLLEYKAQQLIKSGKFIEALALIDTSDKTRVSHAAQYGIAAMLEGKAEEAMAAFQSGQKIAESKNTDCYICLAAMANKGDQKVVVKIDELLASATEAIREGEEWPQYRVELAYLFVSRNDVLSAQQALNDAFELGYLDGQWLSVSPLLSSLHETTAFEELVLNMNTHALAQKQLIKQDPALSAILEN